MLCASALPCIPSTASRVGKKLFNISFFTLSLSQVTRQDELNELFSTYLWVLYDKSTLPYSEIGQCRR